TDGCGSVTITGTTTTSFPITTLGTTVVTWTFTDASGNATTANQNVIVQDIIAPTIVCPADITQNVDAGLSTAVVTYTTPVGTDNCTGVTTTQIAGLPSGSAFPTGTTTNTFEVTDGAGNTVTCSFDVIITGNIIANDDTVNINGTTGGNSTNLADANDTLNGNGVTLGTDVVITTVTDPNPTDGVSLDPITGEVTVDPNTPSGDYTITYTLCSIATPVVCDDATITVTVTGGLIANNDSVSINGAIGGNSINVIDNNDTLNGNGVTLGTDVNIATINDPDPTDGVSLDPITGEVIVAPNTPRGIYTINYTLCTNTVPVQCDDATITIDVTGIIIANDDTVIIDGSTGGSSINIADDNDEINNNPVILGVDVRIASINDTDPDDDVVLDPSTGIVMVLPGTPPGNYTIRYTLCSLDTPVICDTAEITVIVTGTIIAEDDNVNIAGVTGGTSVNLVDDNDTLNGSGVTLGTDVNVTVVNDLDPTDGVNFDPTTGQITVDPNTPPGDYTITYTLCSITDPMVCDDATITVTVDNTPNLALTKTGEFIDIDGNGIPNAGDEIRYAFTVENNGNVDITNIVLTDPLPGIQVTGGPIDLAIGEIDTDSFTAIYTLTADDVLAGSVMNQALVTGQDVNGNDIADLSDDPLNPTDNDLDGDNDFEDVTVTMIQSNDEITIYTGISPNGDGVNDQFRIIGLSNFPNNTLQIFNRWGVKVFEEDGYEQPGKKYFDGYSSGRVTVKSSDQLPVGTYYYVLEYENAAGVRKSKAGYLYINK
ncbi:gliding motility-associated C-terminal domain-containing protein, partial [Aquimarina sp. MMG016]|uniref:T9SS type B sorting domain-containing protein n=1 Tax=Aquimarina sp. MMG016 TaxID=2822690 RepID=UPI001B3A3AD0